jgi:hypothetical protein
MDWIPDDQITLKSFGAQALHLSKPPSIQYCEAETPIDGSDHASDQARFVDKTGSLANLACARVCVVLTKDGETWCKSTSGCVQEWWVSVNPIIGFAES